MIVNLTFLEKSQNLEGYNEKECIKLIVEKCLASGKSTLKINSDEIICVLFQKYGSNFVFEYLISCLNNKKSKSINVFFYLNNYL